MTGDARHENRTSPAPGGSLEKHVAQRLVELCAEDEQFRAADAGCGDVDRGRAAPGIRLPQVMQTLCEGYADRPAMGWRARTLTDRSRRPAAPPAELLGRFDTITYRDLWANVAAVAAAWRHDPVLSDRARGFRRHHRVRQRRLPDHRPGLRDTSGWSRCRCSTTPRFRGCSRSSPKSNRGYLAVSAAYLDLAVESAVGSSRCVAWSSSTTSREIDDQRERLERARANCCRGLAVVVEMLGRRHRPRRARCRPSRSTPAAPTSGWR